MLLQSMNEVFDVIFPAKDVLRPSIDDLTLTKQ